MIRLIFMAIILTVIGGGLYIAYTHPEKLPSQLQAFAPQIKSGVETGLQTAQNLISNGKNAQPAVMGIKTEASSVFQEDNTGKPIHQKAMEFAQYQYCKLVVQSYEDEQKRVSTPSASPTPDSK